MSGPLPIGQCVLTEKPPMPALERRWPQEVPSRRGGGETGLLRVAACCGIMNTSTVVSSGVLMKCMGIIA